MTPEERVRALARLYCAEVARTKESDSSRYRFEVPEADCADADLMRAFAEEVAAAGFTVVDSGACFVGIARPAPVRAANADVSEQAIKVLMYSYGISREGAIVLFRARRAAAVAVPARVGRRRAPSDPETAAVVAALRTGAVSRADQAVVRRSHTFDELYALMTGDSDGDSR